MIVTVCQLGFWFAYQFKHLEAKASNIFAFAITIPSYSIIFVL